MVSQLDGTVGAHPVCIGTRYEVDAVLGRGGMATVYRVTDVVTHKAMALKQLTATDDRLRYAMLVALFEREFRTLAELSHPRVIEAYDYGVDEAGPYYTMELLGGADLRKLSPLPWQEACSLLFGVCSSLALIHSRRLVHRDVSPSNIRCAHDGQAKLIDFGALTSMGAAASIVGTPAFVAPEVLKQSALDGRTDLFSFGATLYYALTGRPPYLARSFDELPELWTVPPTPPSSLVHDIPEALDALVMSLLGFEPAMRPRTAFEVMQRLTAIAGIECAEPLSVSRAYLSNPVLVGRQDAIGRLRGGMTSAFANHGSRSVFVEGEAGVGRSRLLDTCVVEAKVLGAAVLRAGANTAGGDHFAVAQTLAEQLLEVLPGPALASARASRAFEVLFEEGGMPEPGMESPVRLRALAGPGAVSLERQKALSDWVLHVSETCSLAIAIDDVHRVDEPSAALLAVLASEARDRRLFVAATVETGAPRTAAAALEVFAGRSEGIELQALTSAQTEELLGSLFGDVQNLQLVSDSIHRVSGGNPRACMDLAKHLVDRGAIAYEGGGWTLPARLDPGDLPSSAKEAIRDRVAALQPFSRWIAEAQALAGDAFSREDYRRLSPEADTDRIDRALRELVSCQLLVSDGRVYSLAHGGWASALTASLSQEDRAQRHRALAGVYELKVPMAAVRHLLDGGLLQRGVDRLAELFGTVGDPSALQERRISGAERAATVQSALDAAQSLGRPLRELHELRRWIASLSLAAEDSFYWRVAPDWLAQLKRDSGLDDWHALGDADPGSRLWRAMGLAAQRYATTPERDRAYRVDEAIKFLVHYVLLSIAIGARSMDNALIESLPGLLEPFAPVSPLVDIMFQNAIATREARCRAQIDQARARWIQVRDRVAKGGFGELPYVEALQNAGAFAIGSLEARMGLPSTTAWAELLDADPLQHVNGLYLRKVAALQMGDSEAAERWRRQAEVLALQARGRQMFTTTLPIELCAHAAAGDIAGVTQVAARLQPLADACPGWRGYVVLAQALLQQLRGDLEAAREAFERCIAMTSPDPSDGTRPVIIWPPAVAGYLATLVGLGLFEEARRCGEQAIVECKGLEIHTMSHEISRALALAEAKLNDYEAAASRLNAVIAEQEAAGATGLVLGASYEARARIAIWAGDDAALEKYAKLTAREYLQGLGSSLGARWERLMAEMRSATKHSSLRLEEFASGRLPVGHATAVTKVANEFLKEALTAQDRAARVLKLLCDDRAATSGHLYLVGGAGLTLASSLGSIAPTDALTQYVREFFDERMSDDVHPTLAVADEQVVSALNARSCFRDPAGVEYRPVLMTSVGELGGPRYAGVAVLVESGRMDRPAGGAPLVAALSAYLIQSGDTRGIAA